MKLQKDPRWSLLSLFTFFIVIFFVAGSFPIFGVAEAATSDRTAPSIPSKLQMTGKSSSTISLSWTKSKDNKGVKGYNIYQNKKLIGNTASTKYIVKKLDSNKSYSFFIKALDFSGNVSGTSNVIKVTTAKLVIDKAPQMSAFQISPEAGDGRTVSGTITLSANVSDDKGISKVNFYSYNGGKLIKSVTSAPYRANLSIGSVPDGNHTFKAVVYDTSNQAARASKTVTIVPMKNTFKTVGYYTGWSAYSNFQVTDIDASKLTHLNYAFANISSDGRIALGDSWADVKKSFPGDTANQPYKGNFYQLAKLKKQFPHLKTLISVGGWTWSERFSDVALTEQSRIIFAESLLQFILKYGFDGVDLDWEYPVGGGESDNINRREDKQNFTLLLKEIKETFDAESAKSGRRYLLTIAGGAGKWYAANTELKFIHQYVDYIQLMTYDLHGSWDPSTGLNAPLYRDPHSGFYSDWSVQDTVQMYLNNGVPASKLIMGIPFYGRVYNQVQPMRNGLYQRFSGGGSAISYAELQEKYINKNKFTRYWSPDSKVPWLFNGSQFISYDDVESIRYKTSFIKSIGLGGSMMWELSQDPSNVLLTEIYDDLRQNK